MTGTVQRATLRRGCFCALATALSCGLATIGCAEVRIEGSPEAIHVTTDHDAIADVLSAVASNFNVKYRTAIPLDAAAATTYAGSLRQVISRLLDGYDYVIKTDQETTEIAVSGRSSKVVAPSPAAKTPPPEGILSRWR
jgi:hypothetical protein